MPFRFLRSLSLRLFYSHESYIVGPEVTFEQRAGKKSSALTLESTLQVHDSMQVVDVFLVSH